MPVVLLVLQGSTLFVSCVLNLLVVSKILSVLCIPDITLSLHITAMETSIILVNLFPVLTCLDFKAPIVACFRRGF